MDVSQFKNWNAGTGIKPYLHIYDNSGNY